MVVAIIQKRRLLERRATAFEAQKKILNDVEARGADLAGDDLVAWEAAEADLTAVEVQLGYVNDLEAREAALPTEHRELERGGGEHEQTEEQRATQQVLTEYRRYLATGARPTSQEYREAMQYRANSAESDVEMGYLLAPETQAAILLQSVKDLVFVRQHAHVETITESVSLGIPSLDTDLNDADWTQEVVAASEDTALRTGKRELKPFYLTKLVKLSRPLVRRTNGGAERLLNDRLAYKFGITQEKAFISGTGAGQPLGVFTASTQGITTGRDVSTGNSTTAIGADGLIEAKHNLKAQYWNNAQWMFHRTAVKNIRKLKDGNGQYLWAPGNINAGVSGGNPAMICDSPYMMSEYAPSTFTTGLYVGIIGDWSFYWIVDALGLDVQVLQELYAASNQIGYIGRVETDGMPVLEEAFSRVTLA